jgi:hypothetical protein
MSMKLARKILDRIKTPEQAVKLKGKARKEYLDALDEVHGPAQERARKMGFGDETFYHGTTGDIKKFENSKKGLNTNAKSAEKGFFFSSDPSVASDYADLAAGQGLRTGKKGVEKTGRQNLFGYTNDKLDALKKEWKHLDETKGAEIRNKMREMVHPRRGNPNLINSKKYKALEAELKPIQEKVRRYYDLKESMGQNVMPVKLKTKAGKTAIKDYQGKGYRDDTYANLMDKAEKEGKDSIIFKNTKDYAKLSNNPNIDVAAVMKPNQIRSKNAAFDPRFEDSSLVMSLAGKAGKGANKIMDAMAMPQRILMKRAAELAGVKPGETSEESAFNIVDKVSQKMGIPEDNSFANALKASAVAGLETFVDPLGPIGKLAKFNKMKQAAQGAMKSTQLGKGAKIFKKTSASNILKNKQAMKAEGVRAVDTGTFKPSLNKPKHTTTPISEFQQKIADLKKVQDQRGK